MTRGLFAVCVLCSVALVVSLPQSTAFRIDRVISGIRIVGVAPNVNIEDVKTTFDIPQDKEAVVYFEWSGPPGRHNFEGIWRNPAGREAGSSTFWAESATGKFSGNWKLFLDTDTEPGRWSIESWVDGQIVGRYGIDVRKVSASIPGKRAPVSRLPSLAEIYRKANAATVAIEHVAKDGTRELAGSGFFVSPNTIVTSFSVIDGATGLRIVSAAKTFNLAGVIAWNRLQDWALLRTVDNATEFLPVASKAAQGGERCLVLQFGANNERSLADGSIGGVLSRPKIGDRMELSVPPLSTEYDAVKDEATGSPVLNQSGEILGIVVGPATVLPGSAAVGVVRSHNLFEADSPFDGVKVLAVPAGYFAASVARTTLTSLAQLAVAHEFAPDLLNAKYVQSGTIGIRSDSNGNPIGQAFTFRPSVKQLQIFITWNVSEHFGGNASLKVYDDHNRVVFESKPQAATTPAAKSWVVQAGTIPLESIPPGIYRIDYLLNDVPAWRSFFRMIP
jgi:hypothetical protein